MAKSKSSTAVETFQNYVNGKWVNATSGKTFPQNNPARLSEATGYHQRSNVQDTRKAIDAAEAAYPAWRDTPVPIRAEILTNALNLMIERRDEMAKVLTLENGKTLAESKGEINSAIKEMGFQIGEGIRMCGQTMPVSLPGVFAYSVRQPLGVVGIISPWNFPFNVPGRKCTPALVAGNTCVFKPASLTPQTGMQFTKLFADAGLPPGVLNFVTGSGREVGDIIVTDSRIKAISFTGSTEIGMGIHQKAALTLARTQLEMGGKNPIVVLEDANLEEAIKATVLATYACAGQWCTSTSRAVVVRKIAKEFIAGVVEKAKTYCVGDGMNPNTTMGPVCGTAQLEGILGYIEKGKQEGAKLLLGGNQLTGKSYDDGCFIAPTIFGKVKPDMVIAQEEIFGPVLSIIEVEDFEEAIEVANGVRFGLSSSIYTNDLNRAMTFLERTEAGLTHVNLITALKEPQLSFGGIKCSGCGLPEAGQTGIEFFTEHKVAYLKYR